MKYFHFIIINLLIYSVISLLESNYLSSYLSTELKYSCDLEERLHTNSKNLQLSLARLITHEHTKYVICDEMKMIPIISNRSIYINDKDSN